MSFLPSNSKFCEMTGFDSVQGMWSLGPHNAVGYVPQEGGFLTALTASECLQFYSLLRGSRQFSSNENYPFEVLLEQKYLDYPIKSLSGGTKKKLALLAANIGLFSYHLYFYLSCLHPLLTVKGFLFCCCWMSVPLE